jgi:hypothetical protein
MPYTQDELQNYAFYQQLRQQDIEKYHDKLRVLVNDAAVSRSAVEPIRNSAGSFLSFEEELDESRIGLSREAPNEYLSVDQSTPQYRQDGSLEKIISRGIVSLSTPPKQLGVVTLDPIKPGGPTTKLLRNGFIISDANLTEIYYLENNKKRNFVNKEIFQSYEDVLYPGGIGLIFIIKIAFSDLNRIKNGRNMPFHFPTIGLAGPEATVDSTDTGDDSEGDGGLPPASDTDQDSYPFNHPNWDPPSNPGAGELYIFQGINYYWNPMGGPEDGGYWMQGV